MNSGTQTMTAGAMRDRLISRAAADEAFRARLLSDPKGAVRDELDLAIPAGFTIEVHEDAADIGHLVLPPVSKLEEADLEQVAGAGKRDEEWYAFLTIGWDGTSGAADL